MRVRTAMMSLKTKIIIAVTAVAVVAAAVTAGILLTKKDAYRVLKVFELIGSATVTREKTGDLDAYEGMNLESGDKVKVGSDSQMRLSLDGDKYILLDSDSLIELKATGSKKDSRTTIDLKKGSVLNEITSPLSENSSYEVNTPKATMAVRGTSFSVSVKKVGDKFITDINVFHGTVAVQLIDENGNKKGEVVLVTEGNCVTIITEPNKNSENDPTVDGYSYFVKRSADDENSFEKVGEGEDPVYPSIYKYVSENILLRVVSSDSDGTLNISQEIIDKILGIKEAPTDLESSSEESSSDDSEDSDETDDSSEDDSHRTDSKADDSKASSSSSASDSRNNSASSSSQRDNRPSTPSNPSNPSSSSDSSSSSESQSDDSQSDSSETDDSEPTVTKYTVDFVSDDGEVLYTYDVESGNTLDSVPEIPARTGYTGAWIIDGTNKKFTSSTIISSDMTVTAVYTINTYTVTFTAPDADNQNDVPADKTADYGTLLADILPEVPTKTGYSGEWKIGGTDEITASTKVTTDVTVTAVYTINSYTVTFTAPDADNQNDVPADKTADYGTLLKEILPEVPAKTGYSGEWKINGTDEITASTKVTADITVTAVYTINTYTVTFTAPDADDPTNVPADITADYGTLLKEILPEVPTKTGYSGEWKIDGTDEITASTKVTADVTVTAVYTINTYTVTFTAPEADNQSDVPADITADYGTLLADILPEVPTKTGYSGEWKINGTDVITASTKVTADVTVTAVYTINTYTVTFTAPEADNQSDVPADKTADYGTLLADILPEVPTKTGYSGEWKIGGTDEITSSTKVTADITVTAVYTINTYTVTFSAPDADDPTSVPADKTADYGTLLADILPEVPTKTGYSGVWKIDGKENISATTTVTTDITVTAVYTINSYTVTFTAPDADDPTSVPADKTADYGTLLADILPEVPTKTGYSGEWKIDGTDEITASTKVTADVTVTAVYTINTYTVTFTAPDADDPTSVPADKTADYGTLLKEILPEVPAKTGYSGVWKIDGKENILATTTVTADITVTAVYTINSYTVTFTALDADDPTSVPADITADYGTLLSAVLPELPEVPEKTGYDGEWLIDGKTAITDSVIIDSDMTITAVYTIKQFTVSYYDKSYTVNTIMADYNSGLLSVLESLKLENVSSDLSDPYVWTTYGYAWGSTLSGQIRADNTMKVTKDIDTSYSVIAYQKKVVTYYYMNDDGSYTEGGKFYVLSGECVADCDAAYLSSLLGTEYSEFLDDYGNTFDENTTVYMDTNIYAALADKTDPDSG